MQDCAMYYASIFEDINFLLKFRDKFIKYDKIPPLTVFSLILKNSKILV